jgi:DHA2 family multidrug resistance protein
MYAALPRPSHKKRSEKQRSRPLSAIDSTLPALPSGPAAAGKRNGAGAESRPAQMENPDLALPTHWKPRVNPWLIAMTVALAAFMEVLDTSIANVALQHIGGSLGASTDEATWVLTSYLVSNAIVLPLGGWASSLMGRRNFFVLCIAVFTIASFLCGAAPSLPILLICRVLQGAGGGGMQPMAQAIMADSFEPHKRGQAFALYGLVAVLAPSIGPTLGGWITDNFSWRWIFYINIPVGIAAIILVTRLVEDPPWIKADRSLLRNMDYLGLAFLTLAMGGMQIMLDKGEENDWFSSSFICFFATMFVVGIAGLFLWEWRKKNPLINLHLFGYRNFAICCFLMMLVGGVLNANTVLQPEFTQQLLGYNATTAGLALTAGGVALVIMMPLAGIATGKIAARWLAAFGFTIMVITFRYAADVTNLQMSFAEASWLRVVQMLPLPFCFISITTAAYVGMPKEQSNQVAGLINFVRNIGGSILIAVTNAQVTSRAMWHEQHLQQAMQSGNIAFDQHRQALAGFFSSHFGDTNGAAMALARIYSQMKDQARTQGYQDVYMELCWASIVLIALSFMLSKNRPGEGAGGDGML